MNVAFLALFASSMLGGCATAEVKLATRYESEDRLLDAANVWVTELEQDMDDVVARHRLSLLQDRAWDAEVARAATASPEEAMQIWLALSTFRERLAGVDIVLPPDYAVGPGLAAAQDALAAQRYAAGVAASEEARWADAIASFLAAREVRPEYRDTTTRMGAALRAQADLDRAAGRYADAIDRYAAAVAVSGDDVSARWLFAIHAAWGRFELDAGRCRSAFDHLERGGSAATADLERARQCARLELVVPAAEDLTGAAPKGIAVTGILADHVSTELRAQGSAHVRLVDPVSPPPQGPGRRVLVRLRVNEQAQQPEEHTVEGTGKAQTRTVCDSVASDAFVEGVGFLCDTDVVVRWTEHVRSDALRVGGTVRWYGADGVELGSAPFLGVDATEVRWATDYTVEGVAVRRGTDAAPGVIVLPADALPETAPPSKAAGVSAAAQAAARDAAKTVLGALDQVEAGPPPTTLELPALPEGASASPPHDGRAEPI